VSSVYSLKCTNTVNH